MYLPARRSTCLRVCLSAYRSTPALVSFSLCHVNLAKPHRERQSETERERDCVCACVYVCARETCTCIEHPSVSTKSGRESGDEYMNRDMQSISQIDMRHRRDRDVHRQQKARERKREVERGRESERERERERYIYIYIDVCIHIFSPRRDGEMKSCTWTNRPIHRQADRCCFFTVSQLTRLGTG